MLFKKKTKESPEPTPVLGLDQQNQQSNQLAMGVPSMKDLVAPPSFDRGNPDYIKVGNKFVRNFIIAGYPKMISVGWADTIYNYDGDLDLGDSCQPNR